MSEESLKKRIDFFILIAAVLFSPLRAVSQINPHDIIEKSIAAQGGRSALENVKDTVSIRTFKLFTAQGDYLGERKTYSKSEPGKITKFRFEQTLLGMNTIIGFDGEIAWLEQMGKVMAAPQSVTDSIKASVIRENLLLEYKRKECKVEYLGKSDVNRQSCHRVKLTDKQNNETVYYIDEKSYLPLKVEFDAPDETGKISKNEVLDSDFRPFQNLVMPFKTEAYVNGKKLMEYTLKEIEINRGLEDRFFSMPEKKTP